VAGLSDDHVSPLDKSSHSVGSFQASEPMIDSAIPSRQSALVDSKAGFSPASVANFHQPGRDTLSTRTAASLQGALASEPEIRPDSVAAVRQLAADPAYPPADIVAGLARLLVNSPDPSED